MERLHTESRLHLVRYFKGCSITYLKCVSFVQTSLRAASKYTS